ncbi:MAG: DDE-type integrase/transposase/recombinase, partial [Succinivibrionaceae bacterium]|nr:DDE-type integrase/transposase/recombinase [Succinivibrionaceae bacterium]
MPMTRKLGGKFDPSLTYDRAIFLATHSSYEAERNPSLRLTHGSAVRIMCRMRAQGLTLERLRSMTPVEVAGMLARRRQATPDAGQGEGGRSLYLEPDFADLTGRLIRSMDHSGGTTSAKLRLQRKILYEDAYLSRENRERCAREGLRPYSLSHFYKLWRRFEGSRVAPSFRRHYTPGGVAEFDFTGVTMTASSGQRATFAVLVLNYSRKVYVEAIASQGTEDSARAIVNGFHSFGGVTEVLRVDNYAAAVRGPGKYNGEFTDAYRMLAARLGVSLSSMPPRRPGLKGAAEAAVKIATHVLIARMRERERQGQPFASLAEMNAWLRSHLDLVNGTVVRGVGLTRNELFEGTERAALHGVDSWAISLGGIVSMTLG